MKNKIIDTVLMTALFIFLVLALAYVGPAIDAGYEHEVAKQELAKQRQQDRFSKAAEAMCGNGYAVDVEGAVVCKVRKALKAGRAAL